MKLNTDSNFNFLLVGANTNVGQVRKANEDSMTVFETANMKVFVVCDGMGGHVGGKMASETAINAIHNFFLNNITLDPREAIYNSIIVANEAILDKARQQPELAGMGSTCVMLVVTSDGKAYYGHVGDSRIYIVANHHITQLTEDHSVVYEMFKAGVIKTREEMERHPRKNEITSALGLLNMQPPTVCRESIEPEAGNCFLLCSDGLTGMVDDEQIQRIISRNTVKIDDRAEELVKKACNNGGLDNITVELVEFSISAREIGSGGKKLANWKKLLLYLLSVLVVLGGLGWLLSTKFLPKTEEKTDINKDTLKVETAELGETNIFEIAPEPYFAKPVVFTNKGEILKTEITNTLFNDTIIDKNTIEVENNTVSSVAIKGKKIHAEWKTKCDTITILCKTRTGNNCIIKIPVKKTEEIKLKNYITYKLDKVIIVEIDSKVKVKLNKLTDPVVTNFPQAVECDVNMDNNLVVHFKTQDFTSPIKVTVKTTNRIYIFVIPVKMPEEEKNPKTQLSYLNT
ncbi:MAG: Stp1/IreP family PP2C-type Ser/Thr phosphatase [Prevotellaceae bacterium]|jgi:protein phosphatase|nr:Stp1/IreP family PP2C-type Ser/Thr phosphatase [Prevotellaceae bacterium]